LSTDLELDAQQREKAEKILAASPNFGGPPREASQPSPALLDAFEKPTFDATKLELDQGGEAAFNQRVDYLKKLTAILTPAQREKLASSLTNRGDFEQRGRPQTDRPSETGTDEPQEP
jgi:Spy/CpxP family protein refolding chaperone